MRLIALEKGINVAVNSFGKIKTILLDTCLVCLLMGENLWGWPWMQVGTITLGLSLVVSLYSAWLYWRVFSEHADF
jgi:phosphatidylglycerophosphate synthase